MKNFHILITNDDGIQSPGLRAATEAVIGLGKITIVAPSNQQTAMGRSLTGKKNLKLVFKNFMIKNQKIPAYHCDCSPALAVIESFGLDRSKCK
jgi:5'-nucleotidase